MTRSGLHKKWWEGSVDLVITLLLWSYYTIGFVCFFSPFYLYARLFSKQKAHAFQKLNHYFYRGFFLLLNILVPACKWHVEDQVKQVRSGVIIGNHVSYLDPILLISLFKRHTTIAKGALYRIPFYGRMLSLSGYIPSQGTGALADLKLDLIENMAEYLEQGGNFFVFPEGTRQRDGRIGPFNKGAFKIAKLCKAPVYVISIKNTDKLFTPGRFLFHTQRKNRVSVTLVQRLAPDYDATDFSIKKLMDNVRRLLEENIQ